MKEKNNDRTRESKVNCLRPESCSQFAAMNYRIENMQPPSSCRLLSSVDNRMYELDFESAKTSSLLRQRLATVNETEHLVERIEVPGEVLQKVVEWCDHHQDDPAAEDPEEFYKGVRWFKREWDVQFLNMQPEMFFGVVKAAEHLGIAGLVHLCCQHMAESINSKTDDEIRSMFNLNPPANGH